MRPLVICCSQRFKGEMEPFVEFLEKRGVLVFAPDFKRHRKSHIEKSEEERLKVQSYKAKVPGMVHTHLMKIDEVANLGGMCLIFNPLPKKRQKLPNGYVGYNTVGEIFHAKDDRLVTLMMRPHEDESIMSLVPRNSRGRIFTITHPKAKPLDYDQVWDLWLKRWLSTSDSEYLELMLQNAVNEIERRLEKTLKNLTKQAMLNVAKKLDSIEKILKGGRSGK